MTTKKRRSQRTVATMTRRRRKILLHRHHYCHRRHGNRPSRSTPNPFNDNVCILPSIIASCRFCGPHSRTASFPLSPSLSFSFCFSPTRVYTQHNLDTHAHTHTRTHYMCCEIYIYILVWGFPHLVVHIGWNTLVRVDQCLKSYDNTKSWCSSAASCLPLVLLLLCSYTLY